MPSGRNRRAGSSCPFPARLTLQAEHHDTRFLENSRILECRSPKASSPFHSIRPEATARSRRRQLQSERLPTVIVALQRLMWGEFPRTADARLDRFASCELLVANELGFIASTPPMNPLQPRFHMVGPGGNSSASLVLLSASGPGTTMLSIVDREAGRAERTIGADEVRLGPQNNPTTGANEPVDVVRFTSVWPNSTCANDDNRSRPFSFFMIAGGPFPGKGRI
jgi:hypothetical protein